MQFKGDTAVRIALKDVQVDDADIFRAFVKRPYGEEAQFLLGLFRQINTDGNHCNENLNRDIRCIIGTLDHYEAQELKRYLDKFVQAIEANPTRPEPE